MAAVMVVAPGTAEAVMAAVIGMVEEAVGAIIGATAVMVVVDGTEAVAGATQDTGMATAIHTMAVTAGMAILTTAQAHTAW